MWPLRNGNVAVPRLGRVAFDTILGGVVAELAVESGAADLERPRHFRHPSAVMLERESNELAFEIGQRCHFAPGIEEAVRDRVPRFALPSRPNGIDVNRG